MILKSFGKLNFPQPNKPFEKQKYQHKKSLELELLIKEKQLWSGTEPQGNLLQTL